MKTLVLESTSPFQGLPELVAYREGLFEKEGLSIEWADRDEAGVKTADTSLTDVKGADPFVSHGTLFEQGKADMYNACPHRTALRRCDPRAVGVCKPPNPAAPRWPRR